MKNIFQCITGIMAGVVLFSACETDNKHAEYTQGNGVTFSSANHLVFVPVADSYFEVPLNRSDAGSAETISLEADLTEALAKIFTVPQSVVFNAGEYTAMIKVGVNTGLLEPGKSFDFALYADADKAVSGRLLTTVKCSVIPNWVAVGEGTFTYDGFFDGTDRMTLEQAEGSNFYRLAIFSESTYVQFSVSGDGVINADIQRAGFNYSSYGAVSVRALNGKSKREGKLFSFYFTYTVSAGSFGEMGPETFELD